MVEGKIVKCLAGSLGVRGGGGRGARLRAERYAVAGEAGGSAEKCNLQKMQIALAAIRGNTDVRLAKQSHRVPTKCLGQESDCS